MNDEPFSDDNGKNNINSNHEVTKKNEKAFKNQAEEDSLKECPQCAESVKEKAKICRFCTHEFETEELSPIDKKEEDLLKECPQCAESVKEKAKICRFCTHEFETEELSPIDKKEEDLLKECPQCAEYIKKAAIKCKYCGESLKNPTSDSENNQLTPNFIFDGLINAFEENLEFQIQEGGSCQITEVEIGNYSLLIYQSKAMEGLEYLESKTFPGITLSLPLMLKSPELLRFQESDEYDLFSQDSDNSLLGDEFINYYIDLENDTHQAAIIVSNVFLNCFKVSSNDFVKLTTNNFPASPETIIETESIQKDAFTMKPAEELYKPNKNQKKKKSKFKIFIWLLLVTIIYLYFSGNL